MPTGSIQLTDGSATPMGDGCYALQQHDEYGKPQSVVVHIDDLRAVLAAYGA